MKTFAIVFLAVLAAVSASQEYDWHVEATLGRGPNRSVLGMIWIHPKTGLFGSSHEMSLAEFSPMWAMGSTHTFRVDITNDFPITKVSSKSLDVEWRRDPQDVQNNPKDTDLRFPITKVVLVPTNLPYEQRAAATKTFCYDGPAVPERTKMTMKAC
jgi:hypothetical protein